jgi:uncharacterized protein with beta-barrel porin domain/membrane-associated phospholipid phosphatase
VVIVAVTASIGVAQAQTANETPSNVNVLNLLSPFLTLNSTTYSASAYSPAGPATLSANLSQAISINNSATTALQQLAISDKNLLGSATNTVTGLTGNFGVAANLGGGLPTQTISTGLTPAMITGSQPVGGLGTQLGAIYVTGVGSSTTTTGPLSATVNLLVSAYNFTSSDLGAAKDYFANGTTNGTTTAVAPAGFSLPTFNGLPNTTNSVYDLAYGVTNQQSGQDIYGSSRPVQVAPNSINQFDPTALSGLTTNPSFPSGHTTYAYTDSILLAMLVPQEYQNMLSRGSQFANSRIVLGVHYPLDIIGSRSLASYDLAQAFTNAAYINNATMTGTAINLSSLFTAAQANLPSYLASQCGASVATCATSSANTTNNPYVPSAANLAAYTANLTYGLPTLTFAQAPREAAPTGGPDASILLAPIYGGSTSAAQTLAPTGGLLGNLSTNTINQIVVNTETNALAAFYGTSLSYWARINLYAADGYFGGVTGLITLASTDQVNTNVVVAGATTNVNGDVVPAGVFSGTGTVTGNTTVASGGTLAPGVTTMLGLASAPGKLTLNGNLQFSSGSTYLVQVSPTATSLAAVSGTASIGSGAAASAYFVPGTYTVGSKTAILTTSAGGLSGTFSGITSNGGVNVTPVLSYDPQDVYLTLGQAQLPSLPSGAPANAIHVFNALNGFAAGGGAFPASFQNLYFLSSSSLVTTLNQLANQTAPAADIGMQNEMNSFLRLTFDFAGQGSGGANVVAFAPDAQPAPEDLLAYAGMSRKDAMVMKAPPAPAQPYWEAWTAAFGGTSEINGNTALGSQNLNTQIYGGVIGLDYRAGGSTMGFALAGGQTFFELSNGFGTGNTDFGQGAVYAKQEIGPLYLAAAIATGANAVSTSRSTAIGAAGDQLNAAFTAATLAERGEIGYHFALGKSPFGLASVTPYGAVQAQTIWTPTYSETVAAGSGATATTTAAQSGTSPRTELGAWAETRLLTGGPTDIVLRGRAAWVHDYDTNNAFTDTFLTLPGASFVVNGPQRPSDSALLTAMAEVPVSRNVIISVKFDGEFAGGANTWAGTGMVRYLW